MSEAAEVAEDYRLALEDLSANTRFEISNLTVIARENTEHALVISEVLEKHILKTAPSKKLPALYVLDSIVKNVGTPYTLYLGRNIFKTFMEAYTVVDNATRKRMEEMLKTWKQPVAGSMDTRPVFPTDLVRPIENALMKAKAAMMPQAQIPGRPRSAMPPHRDTPTPPGMRGSAAGTPTNFNGQHGAFANGAHPPPGYPSHPGQPQAAPYPPHSAPQAFSSNMMPFQPPADAYGAAGASQPVGVHIETLNSDIQNLIVAMRAEFAQSPHDPSVQTRLRALLDLQHIVQSTSLPPEQLGLIKNQVTELATVTLKKANAAQNTPVPQQQQQQQHQQPSSLPVAPSPAPPAPAASAKTSVTLDSLLGAGAMAALLARQSTPNPPPPHTAAAAIRSPQPAQAEPVRPSSVPTLPASSTPGPTPAPAQGQAPNPPPSSLMEQLRAAGLLPPAATPVPANAAVPPPAQTPAIPLNIASLLAAHRPASGWGTTDVRRSGLNSAALKQQFRPENVTRLYDELGQPCSQCGRRFKTDAEGKKNKMAHMDWHFRVHQRSTEAEKRGTHRSWYEDKHSWVRSREVVDAEHTAAPEDSAAQASRAAAEAAKPKYIPVPDAGRGINNVCPICQDKFENKWLDTAQEWVWLDAVLVGGRAYHASCHAEATQDRDEAAAAGPPRRTPEPVLGKRKAETGLASPKVRSLKTSA